MAQQSDVDAESSSEAKDSAQSTAYSQSVAQEADSDLQTDSHTTEFGPDEALTESWQETGGEAGPYGRKIGGIVESTRGGYFQRFSRAVGYYTPTHQVYFVEFGPVLDVWGRLNWQSGAMGYPVGAREVFDSGVVRQSFEGGDAVYSPGRGAFFVRGSMLELWDRHGGVGGYYGLPTSDVVFESRGTYQRFEKGVMYWSPRGGTHFVEFGPVLDVWGRLNWQSGAMGYPVGAREVFDSGVVRQSFEGGDAVYSPGRGAFFVRGSMLELWDRHGGVGGYYGLPTSDVVFANGGAYQRFQNGVAYWHPTAGTHFAYGEILNKWGRYGWQGGRLGFPTSDPFMDQGTVSQTFQRGVLWDRQLPARTYYQNVPSAGQPNGYYCGPTSGYMVAAKLGAYVSAYGAPLSIGNLASSSYMNTDGYGYTSFHDRKFEYGMNAWLGQKMYSTIHTPSVEQVRSSAVRAIETGTPLVVDSQERRGGPHFNNHSNATFSHIMVVDAYNPATDEVLFADPGYTLWPGAQSKFWYPNLGRFTQLHMQVEVENDGLEHIGIYTP